jgi:hypothetical protein
MSSLRRGRSSFAVKAATDMQQNARNLSASNLICQTLICQTKTPNKEIGAAKALQLKPHNKSRTTKKRPRALFY